MSEILKDYLSHNKAFFEHLRNKKSINDRKDVDFAALSSKVHEEFDPIFVLSTGRNGTLLLTNLLGKSKEAIVLHEPEPELSMPSKLAYEKHLSDPTFVSGMFEGARYEYLRTAFLLHKKYIETNNRITFFAFEIAKLYPNSKFIHLVRNPSSFIKSGLGRNWYSGETLYDEARIVMNDSKVWNTLNQYEKIAWLWNETNQFIEEFKTTIESTRVLTVKAEDLFKSVQISNDIFTFCELNPISNSAIAKIIGTKTNAGKAVLTDDKLLRNSQEKYCLLTQNYGYKSVF
jgi:hypothetical protein